VIDYSASLAIYFDYSKFILGGEIACKIGKRGMPLFDK
jgi:hypothetical protein